MESTNKMGSENNMEICDEKTQEENLETESYYQEDDYDWEMDCPTDSEEALEIAMMYLDV